MDNFKDEFGVKIKRVRIKREVKVTGIERLAPIILSPLKSERLAKRIRTLAFFVLSHNVAFATSSESALGKSSSRVKF